ncbi:putative isoflavone 7-O-glucosyltransferase [Lupinus albus]|uniref:Glycosyltransferase n=1 Tax=Lupinus albus TaxID=3870 RepID=A0A6A4NFU0_LUPAL|nr:putative isoflavone 7-O-glucosyltransferase [Lupinus albus]
MKDTIVLYSSFGRGHIFSVVELGKLIITHNPSFSIEILIPTPPNTTAIDTTTFGCDSSITFHHIPIPQPPSGTTLSPATLIFHLIRYGNHNLHQVLQSISKTSKIKAIVLDFLNHTANDVIINLGIPTFFYYTSGASPLCVLLYYKTIMQINKNDQCNYIEIPGFPRISKEELPSAPEELENNFCDISATMSDCEGIIINTFNACEGRAVKALQKGLWLCFPEESNPAPIFCIGPVTSVPGVEKDENGCLSWLDSQPSQSVVLLSFGSLGRFSKTQLKEIAIGLEKSEQRFLWVVRSESDEDTLEDLLPEGFLDRTKDKGMVVRNWAPQAKILSHDSVGGFVTHCGWNSVLEAVCEGVPMVTWPLYAEQTLNRVVLVQEMKVALALKESENGFVSATELGDRVKELMDSEIGKEIRERVMKMKVSSVEARSEGGSSYVDLNRLIQLWKEKDHLSLLSPNTPFFYNFSA